MATYYIDEARFALPDKDLVDRTVHVLEAKLPGGDALGLLVLRRTVEEGKSLRDLARDHVADDARRLGGFVVIDETETTIAGAPAILVSSRWRHGGAVLYQRQAHVAVHWKWMLFAVTGPLAERAACDEAFEGILSSLVWRDG
jgi:hypothetical protein